jgi:uncharacterized phage-associated protein
MPVSPFAATRRICKRGNWNVTNLALQKILYLAHMVHMGRNDGARLIDSQFEAWDYGPVQPNIYHKVKFAGNDPVPDVFYGAHDLDGLPEAETIDEACEFLLKKSPGELVSMTHWKAGAWAKNYRPGVRGIVIPDRDIIDEYRARVA